jgi:hypothetical protein
MVGFVNTKLGQFTTEIAPVNVLPDADNCRLLLLLIVNDSLIVPVGRLIVCCTPKTGQKNRLV